MSKMTIDLNKENRSRLTLHLGWSYGGLSKKNRRRAIENLIAGRKMDKQAVS